MIYNKSSCLGTSKMRMNILFGHLPQYTNYWLSPFTNVQESQCFKQPTQQVYWADGIFPVY